jgi:ribosome-associated protein
MPRELPSLNEVTLSSSRSGGPGGQHVNKVATKVTVRWHLGSSSSLSEYERGLIRKQLASYLTLADEIVMHEGGTRSRSDNEELLIKRLRELVRVALIPPKKRRKTRVTYGQKQRRLEGKSIRSKTKSDRRWRSGGE